MFLAIALAAAVDQTDIPAATISIPVSNPVPTSDMRQLITVRDFPADAPADALAWVNVDLDISASGRVTDCRMWDYSYAEKDAITRYVNLTCSLLKERARFFPARNVQGGAVAGSYRFGLGWSRKHYQEQMIAPPPPAPQIVTQPRAIPRPIVIAPTKASPPPPRFAPKGATPRGNPAAWITQADYPRAAIRESMSGLVRFRVMVGPDGRVTDCFITRSSGHDLLDHQTCSQLSSRARFNPATDSDGQPARGTWAATFRWNPPDTVERSGK
jgi:TonB family protein